jgi:alkanesulfonate monooxygenase SsuD/methylene tetrahydromethanopterin reductase-like flavin-dependent oxidoreductase (luciferase family)
MPDDHRPLKVGLELPVAERRARDDIPGWSDIRAMALRAEEVGFDSLWVEDHLLLRPDGQEPQGLWECWSIVAALAALTSHVEIGTYVACTAFRNPALLAKMADTVDEISGGRLILGLGAGWNETDFTSFGYPFDHLVSRFEEALTIIRKLLRDGQIDCEGVYYAARDCELRPRGPRRSGPPILVGASGPRMLEITARLADAWNGACNTVSGYAPLRAQVDAACEAVGREPASLERTTAVLVDFTEGQAIPSSFNPARLPPLSGNAEQIADTLRDLASSGVSHAQITTIPMTIASIEAFAPVLELLGNRM